MPTTYQLPPQTLRQNHVQTPNVWLGAQIVPVAAPPPVFPEIHTPHPSAPLRPASARPTLERGPKFFILKHSEIRFPSVVSPNSTADCPIFDAQPTFQPGYKAKPGVSAKATQDMGVLYLTHPTWGTSFTNASILQRAKPPGPIDRSKQFQ